MLVDADNPKSKRNRWDGWQRRWREDGQRERDYRTWRAMMERCYLKNHEHYHSYGGRGITVCERWQTFENYLADMGPKPVGMSIGRINNDLGYSLENCRWETIKEQASNRRTSVFVKYQGKRQTLREWADELGIDYSVLQYRVRRAGWPIEKAFEQKIRERKC